MQINELPKWTAAVPTLLGVTLGFLGVVALPHFGIRNIWGPILGLPAGFILGVLVLSIAASRRN